MLPGKPILLTELYLQPLHLSNQEAKGKRLGFLQDPEELQPRRLLEGAWLVGGRLSCCLSLRKANHKLKRVTEVLWVHVESWARWGLGGVGWLGKRLSYLGEHKAEMTGMEPAVTPRVGSDPYTPLYFLSSLGTSLPRVSSPSWGMTSFL